MNKNIILLRGLFRAKGHWGDFLDRVVAEFPNDRVLAVDLPGIGDLAEEKSPLHIFGIAERVHKEILQAELIGESHLFGISLGGMVALELLAHFPRHYQKALVVNTSSAWSAKTKRLRLEVWPKFIKAVMELNPVKREENVVPLLINSPEGRERATELWCKLAKDLPFHPLVGLAQLKAAAEFRPSEKLKNAENVRLLVSMGDLFVDPSCSELLQKRYHWEMKTHPWGGHDLVWDDPDWLIAEMRAFFS